MTRDGSYNSEWLSNNDVSIWYKNVALRQSIKIMVTFSSFFIKYQICEMNHPNRFSKKNVGERYGLKELHIKYLEHIFYV